MAEHNRFQILLRDAMNGDEAAAQKLFDDYAHFIIIAIRRRLNKRLRTQFDSFDLAQSVWFAFFNAAPEDRVFETPEKLLAFLSELARNKVVDVTRKGLIAEKRNMNREQPMDDSRAFDKGSLAANQPTPSRVVMWQEEWREFLRRQPPVYQRIFILYAEGLTPPEIARESGINERMVRRVVQRYLPTETTT